MHTGPPFPWKTSLLGGEESLPVITDVSEWWQLGLNAEGKGSQLSWVTWEGSVEGAGF